MKKLEILVLVLAMASMAQGKMLYYQLSGGGTDVQIDTTITINVYGDYDATAFMVGAVKITATGGADFSNVTPGTVNAGFDLLKTAGILRDGSSYSVYITGISGVRNLTSANVPANSVLYTFSLTIGEQTFGDKIYIDDYLGTVWGGSPKQTTTDGTAIASPAMSVLTLNIIPEPMTVLLLGFGGLFLRRRK